jgi:hypothetical protein
MDSDFHWLVPWFHPRTECASPAALLDRAERGLQKRRPKGEMDATKRKSCCPALSRAPCNLKAPQERRTPKLTPTEYRQIPANK